MTGSAHNTGMARQRLGVRRPCDTFSRGGIISKAQRAAKTIRFFDASWQSDLPSNPSFASLILPANTALGRKYRRIRAFDSTSAPIAIARIGDGNIIRIGDSGDSWKSYCFHMKSSSAILGGQNGAVVINASGRNDFMHVNKH